MVVDIYGADALSAAETALRVAERLGDERLTLHWRGVIAVLGTQHSRPPIGHESSSVASRHAPSPRASGGTPPETS